jgi:hypothetical protein
MAQTGHPRRRRVRHRRRDLTGDKVFARSAPRDEKDADRREGGSGGKDDEGGVKGARNIEDRADDDRDDHAAELSNGVGEPDRRPSETWARNLDDHQPHEGTVDEGEQAEQRRRDADLRLPAEPGGAPQRAHADYRLAALRAAISTGIDTSKKPAGAAISGGPAVYGPTNS